MIFTYDITTIAILLPILLFSLAFHEFAHAWAAYKLGDQTAKHLGRLTLNPVPHIDMFGALMVLFVGFGWAKPVPVNSRNLKRPNIDMVKIALAGPGSNLLLALIGGFLAQSLNIIPLQNALYVFTKINVALAIFNLIPLAPLDGSQIISAFLSKYKPSWLHYLHSYSSKILFGAIILGAVSNFSPIWWLIGPIVKRLTLLFLGHQ